MVRIASEDNKTFSVDLVPNLAQDVLSTGPRFPTDIFTIFPADTLGFNTSGVLCTSIMNALSIALLCILTLINFISVVLGINKGVRRSHRLRFGSPIQTYHVTGRLGVQTETNIAGSLTTMKATYDHVRQGALLSLIASMQAQFQKAMFDASGVSLQSQAAYELACKGLIRPKSPKECVIYGIRCIRFVRSDFTLEINSMNASEARLALLINQIALDLKSVAHCTKIRRTHYGYFSYENTLLRSQWHLPNIIQSIADCEKVWDEHPDMISEEVSTPVGQSTTDNETKA